MKKFIFFVILIPLAFLALFTENKVYAPHEVSFPEAIVSTSSLPVLSLYPSELIQGEPAIVEVNNSEISDIKNISFDGQTLGIFEYKGNPSAFIGVDLKKQPGIYEVKTIFADGRSTSTKITVKEREKYEEQLGVPDKLGGNTPENQAKVVSTLEKENAELASIFTGAKSFWNEDFVFPISSPVITDSYGYSRLTGAYTIIHKGVDLRAEKGTEVRAMNRGVVRIAKEFTVYGKTIVIDHGLGLMTFYMHLSRIDVGVGELVLPGEIIGLSGDTGYAEFPHLHITVRIDNVSIDPIKFLDIFSNQNKLN